jgi:hypothetical protein
MANPDPNKAPQNPEGVTPLPRFSLFEVQNTGASGDSTSETGADEKPKTIAAGNLDGTVVVTETKSDEVNKEKDGKAGENADPKSGAAADEKTTDDPPKNEEAERKRRVEEERRKTQDAERLKRKAEADRRQKVEDENRQKAAADRHRRAEAERQFSYPAEDLVPLEEDGARFRHVSEVADLYAKRLADDGVLFVTGAHAKLVETAALEVAFHEQFMALRKLKLYVDDHPECPLHSVLLESRIGCLGETQPGLRDGGREIVFAGEVDTVAALAQVRECHSRLKNSNRRDRKVFFVFWVFGEALKQWRAQPWDTPLPEWKIEALTELLADYGVAQADRPAIIAALKQGQDEKRWPREEANLLTEVEEHLKAGGVIALQQELIIRQAKDISQLPPGKAKAQWDSARLLEKATLFVAVYFPRVTIHQFETLVGYLLENETVELEEEEPITVDGKPATRIVRRSVRAIDRWELESERIFSRLGLAYKADITKAGTKDEDELFAQFEEGAMREAYEAVYFPPDANRFFKRLHATGLLFDPKTRHEIVQALVEVTTRMAVRQRDVYNEEWLLGQFAEITNRVNHYAGEAGRILKGLSELADDRARLRQVIAGIEKQWHSYFRQLHNRLVSVCQGFLANKKTAPIVNAFIRRLIDRMQPDGTLPLKLIEALRPAEFEANERVFETSEHVRQLFEQTDDASRRELVQSLIEQMRESPEAEQKILARMAGWHPPREEPRAPLSGVRLWSLAFIFAIFEEYRYRTDVETEAQAQRRQLHPFAEGAGAPALGERVEMIAQWLSHPAFFSSLERVLEEPNPEVFALEQQRLGERFRVGESCLAEMLESWHAAAGARGAAVTALADRLATLLDRVTLERLRVLVRRIGQAQDWKIFLIREAERPQFAERKARAFALAAHLDPPRAQTKPDTNSHLLPTQP